MIWRFCLDFRGQQDKGVDTKGNYEMKGEKKELLDLITELALILNPPRAPQ